MLVLWQVLPPCYYSYWEDVISFSLIIVIFPFQVVRQGRSKWISSYWNILDVICIALYFAGFLTRMSGLLVEGRILYAIDLMLFITRILEIFYVSKTLGPYVVMIGRMVNMLISETLIFVHSEKKTFLIFYLVLRN